MLRSVSAPNVDVSVDVTPDKSGAMFLQVFLAEGECSYIDVLHISTASFEATLSIRTWAIFRRNKVVGTGLAALNIGHLVVQCVFVNDVLKNTRCMF
jgi:hypothetical protein